MNFNHAFKISIAFVICIIMLILSVSCNNSVNDGFIPIQSDSDSSWATSSSVYTSSDGVFDGNSYLPESAVSAPASSAADSGQVSSNGAIIPDTPIVTKDIWMQMPFVTKSALNMGYSGGEGCQWMTFITFDRTDGSTAYACVDVGGLLKSDDGGKSWYQSTIGLDTEGSTGVTVDPTNKKRVLVVGGASSQNSKNGLYLSTDEGFSWSPKKLVKVKGHRDFRRQIAFDETSYDAAIGGCRVIYWSTENISGLSGKGVYKSTDGGNTWKLMNNSSSYAGCNIAVHPKTGVLYLANSTGLYKSTDGATIQKTSFSKNITYLDTSKSDPNKIFITATDDMYVYDMSKDTAIAMNSVGYPNYPCFISVAPTNSDIMVMQSDYQSNGSYHGNVNYYSTNGGKNWKEAKNDYTGSFIPYNQRQNPSSFHPKDANIVIKLGGDFIMRSTDGGKNYKLSNDGNSAMCIGGKFNFNVNDYNMISISSQDYNGGYSSDGGKSWTYLNWSGNGWGGNAYGSYMINDDTMVAGVSSTGWKGTRELCVTFNRGRTIVNTKLVVSGDTIGMGVPGDPNIVFFGEYRSTDAGKNWSKMSNCTAVYCASSDGSKLFGVNGKNLMISTNKGASWSTAATVSAGINDVAYSTKSNTAFVTAGGSMYKIDLAAKSVRSVYVGIDSLKSVAVDPGNNDIMYTASGKPGVAYAHKSAWRSVDGGKTWECINRAVGDGRVGPDGGRAVSYVRVDGNGYAWFVGHCRGIWKIARPNT